MKKKKHAHGFTFGGNAETPHRFYHPVQGCQSTDRHGSGHHLTVQKGRDAGAGHQRHEPASPGGAQLPVGSHIGVGNHGHRNGHATSPGGCEPAVALHGNKSSRFEWFSSILFRAIPTGVAAPARWGDLLFADGCRPCHPPPSSIRPPPVSRPVMGQYDFKWENIVQHHPRK